MKKIILVLILTISSSILAYSKSKPKNTFQDVSSKIEKKFNEMTTEIPQDFEVCFSPDEPCDLKLLKFIESAKSSIDVAVFDINLDQIVHALLIQSKKIKVRVLVDKRQSKGPHSLVSTLVKGGASVKYGSQRGVMHNKFVIIDQNSLETGSFNYTNHAYKANQENQIYIQNPKVVERYIKRFEQSWMGGKEVTLDSLSKDRKE